MEAPGLTSLREVESLTGWLLWSLQLDDELLRAKESGPRRLVPRPLRDQETGFTVVSAVFTK